MLADFGRQGQAEAKLRREHPAGDMGGGIAGGTVGGTGDPAAAQPDTAKHNGGHSHSTHTARTQHAELGSAEQPVVSWLEAVLDTPVGGDRLGILGLGLN